MIENVINKGQMPPWRPDTSYVRYLNCRALNAEEKKKIINWVRNVKIGDKLPFTSQATGQSLDGESEIIAFPGVIELIPSETDTTISFEIPFCFNNELDVSRIVFYSSDINLVHHANFFFEQTDSLGNIVYGAMDNLYRMGMNNASVAYGYAPGNKQLPFEKGYGYHLFRFGVVRGDIHISRVWKKTKFSFGIYLFKSDSPIDYALFMYMPRKIISNPRLVLEPNTEKHFVHCYEVTEDIYVKLTHPHMHVFGKKFLSYAVTPIGDTVHLAKIDNWNFYEQEFYEFETPAFIPSGSRIYTEGWYDNTDKNPYNPYSPPILITEGWSTKWSTNHEMLLNPLIYFKK